MSMFERLNVTLINYKKKKIYIFLSSIDLSFVIFSPDLKTALVERNDFSSGTSSRSTKLIHGGVRYLQKAIMQLDYEQVPPHPPFFYYLIESVALLHPHLISFSPPEQYMMVKEALHERANLLEIAPHLSAPLPIMLPVYK